MNILIIGNGFDLAHKLPTQYNSFLNFIKFILRIPAYYGTASDFKIDIDGYDFSDLDDGVKMYIEEIICDTPSKPIKVIWEEKTKCPDKSQRITCVEKMISLSADNVWIKWFQKKLDINPGWIDFEAEISRVVQEFEKIEAKVLNQKLDVRQIKQFESDVICLFTCGKIPLNSLSIANIDCYKSKMLNDLNNLIHCFEIYLEDCVKNIDKNLLSTDIFNLQINKLLSFNYTDTYKRLYECKQRNVEYDYIHGKSNLDSDKNNMVLGIDDYLDGEERFKNTNFIEFKKYYQRLYKKTGCTYKTWIERINTSKLEENNVYIFGHSLAITDKDVLKAFITNKKTKITIFYYDEKQYSQQIVNLVHMLGPDALNAMVYGGTPKISFVKQHEMVNRNDSEWNILKDRNLLWSVQNLGDENIRTLCRRIKEKAENKDLKYFQNQENVISLYNALVSNLNSDFGLHDDLMKICEQLYDENKHDEFDSYSWAEPDYSGSFHCDRRTQQFVYDVNTLNLNIVSKETSSLELDDVEALYKQLLKSKISKENALELFDKLLDMFHSSNDDCSLIWMCIYRLQNKCPDLKWRELVIEKKTQAKWLDKIRLMHILDAIEENEYYEEQARQEAEYEAREAMRV